MRPVCTSHMINKCDGARTDSDVNFSGSSLSRSGVPVLRGSLARAFERNEPEARPARTLGAASGAAWRPRQRLRVGAEFGMLVVNILEDETTVKVVSLVNSDVCAFCDLI